MRLSLLQHVSFEGPGAIADWVEPGNTLQVVRLDRGDPFPKVDDLDGLIVMGGPMGVGDDQAHPWLRAEKQLIAQALAAERRVLGICLGAQLVANVLGARVAPNAHKEIGWHAVEWSAEARTLFGPLPATSIGVPVARRHLRPAAEHRRTRLERRLPQPGLRSPRWKGDRPPVPPRVATRGHRRAARRRPRRALGRRSLHPERRADPPGVPGALRRPWPAAATHARRLDRRGVGLSDAGTWTHNTAGGGSQSPVSAARRGNRRAPRVQ